MCSKTKTKLKIIINAKFRTLTYVEESELAMLEKTPVEDFQDISCGRREIEEDFNFSFYIII